MYISYDISLFQLPWYRVIPFHHALHIDQMVPKIVWYGNKVIFITSRNVLYIFMNLQRPQVYQPDHAFLQDLYVPGNKQERVRSLVTSANQTFVNTADNEYSFRGLTLVSWSNEDIEKFGINLISKI